ncbi:cytochrome c oxidase assembly protein [Novosphingobium sp. JCM 18896]|uniref:cytochrome c oxidase assembly protein n=1 Tax=Novosphingobium sp. JCM 18896 TaxID=2989731 RepID=UPI002222FF65|nr:cytochrome c oxidase assembly protein [Novosphingobium sp. JCM 18896]MCW1430246.1 cytochrome c oxidase assembly protein [Novosphingobium sp. JCM 18896]
MSSPLPYCGAPPLPVELWDHWNLDPFVIAGLLGAFWAGRALGARMTPWSTGIAILALLFVSPLCALSSALFAMRVAHHVILTGVVAPLLAMALPRAPGSVARWAAAHALAFWLWHAPPIYGEALASDMVYWLMQATLLGSALMFWRAVRAAAPPLAVASLLATMVQMGLLGALLTFTTTPLYAWHLTTTQGWGLSPLADQQLAGLIMWVVGGALYLAAALKVAGGILGGAVRTARA